MWSRHRRRVDVKTKEPPPTFKSVLVPVDGSPESLQAVEFACSMAKRTKGKVHVVHVIEVRRSLPLDAELVDEAQRGEEILGQAEKVAKRQDFEVEGDLLQAREAGHAIIDEAIERQADAIVLGVPFGRPFGEFELGRVPAHMLKTAPCEVILLRMPPGALDVRHDHGLRPHGRPAGDHAGGRRPRGHGPGPRQVRLRPPAAELQGQARSSATAPTRTRCAGPAPRRADAFVAATRGDNRNALAAQVAKHVFQIPRVGSVIFDPIREEVYREPRPAHDQPDEDRGGHAPDASRSERGRSKPMFIVVAGAGKVGYPPGPRPRRRPRGPHHRERPGPRATYVAEELGDEVVMQGDACDAATMERAGMERADLVVAVTGDDEDNLTFCQIAKAKFTVPRAVARINNPQNEALFRKLGIDAPSRRRT